MTGDKGSGRRLAAGHHGFADIQPGDWLETGEAKITAALIDGFADLCGDRFEIHMSDDAAARHGFSGRVAHGLLVLSVVDGLKNEADAQFKAVASLNWNWSFRRPVIAGDTIRVKITVLEKRQTKKPDRGFLRLGFDVTNQRGELVQDGENLLMVYA
jgi:3-hydroxybutyryl-CoA dehydratase